MQRLQYKQEKERNLTKEDKEHRVLLRVMLGFACASALCFIMAWVESYRWVHTPESSKNCVGKQYEVVEQQFKDAGFNTVRSEAVEDLYDGFLHNDKGKIGTVNKEFPPTSPIQTMRIEAQKSEIRKKVAINEKMQLLFY